jgi:hypothetical protein
MQVQIALEDEARPKEDREALKKREKALLKAHRRGWLGELAPFVLDAKPLYGNTPRIEAHFTRGWLTGLVFHVLAVNEARALARTREALFLQQLIIEDTAYENPGDAPTSSNDTYYQPGPDVPEGIDEFTAPALHALLYVPHLAGVRVLRYGDGPTSPGSDGERHGSCSANGEIIHELVARMPRLEELYLYAYDVKPEALFAQPMPRLRILRVDHETNYPFEVLAANPTLGSLTYLLCHPHAQRPDDPDAYIRLDQLRAICRSPHLTNLTHLQLRLTDFGDDGVRELIASGILKRLKALDLSLGCVTDEGAKLLAACPDLKNLTSLDLCQNAIEGAGIAALEATGVQVNTQAQHGEHPSRMEEHGYLEYLSNGDWE